MADDADIAADLQAMEVTSALTRVAAHIPTGTAGECNDCGETMPRLVGGRCGYCRDGRRPPLSRFDDGVPARPAPPVTASAAPIAPVPAAQPALPPPVQPEETTAMPEIDYANVSIHLRGDTLAAFRTFASDQDLTLGRAGSRLIEEALRPKQEQAAPAASVHWDGGEPSAKAILRELPNGWLADELARRMGEGVSTEEYAAAVTRAEKAEGQLALIGGVISGHVQQPTHG